MFSYSRTASGITRAGCTLRFMRPFARATLYQPSRFPLPMRVYAPLSTLPPAVPDEPLVVELKESP